MIVSVFFFTLGFLLITDAPAMTIKIAGDQLILGGSIVDGDAGKVREALAKNFSIKTVVVRNSPGGLVPTAYEIGNLMREKLLRTAVSGYCYSGCSRIFLGGTVRVFTDDYPLRLTNVGFHGHYYTSGPLKGQLNTQTVRNFRLKDWIIAHSDGKADPDLVERWINIPINIGFIHFYHPDLVKEYGVATFFCERGPIRGKGIFGCESINKNALDLGIITGVELIKSNDQEELRASFPKIPQKTDYANINDLKKLPVKAGKALAEYKRYLRANPPKAFAIAPDNTAYAWQAGSMDSIDIALSKCSERAQKACSLYAVDDQIVWQPSPQNGNFK